jgi:hypothetical protein
LSPVVVVAGTILVLLVRVAVVVRVVCGSVRQRLLLVLIRLLWVLGGRVL